MPLHRKALAGLLASLVAFGAARVAAIDAGHIQLERWAGSGWIASGIQAEVDLGAQALTIQVDIDRLHVDGLAEDLRAVHIACAEVDLAVEVFSCSRAQARAVLPYLGPQTFGVTVKYRRRTGALDVELAGLKLAQGAAQLNAQLQGKQWTLAVNLKQGSVEELLKIAGGFLGTTAFSGKGVIDVAMKMRGQGATPNFVQWELAAHSLTLANSAGNLATDSLALSSSGSADKQASAWRFQFKLSSPAGQAYAEPVFLDFGKYALAASGQGVFQEHQVIELEHFELTQNAVAQSNGSVRLSLQGAPFIRDLQLNLVKLEFPGAYTSYLQPFLLNTGLKALNTAGSLGGKVVVANDAPSGLDLELRDVSLDDGAARLALNGVHGRFRWKQDDTTDGDSHQQSQIAWKSGSFLGLALGASELRLEAWGTNLRVAEPARIPVFNGALALDAFRIRKLGTPQMAFMLDAAIEPINVAQLCRAFGWPEFGGELAGKVTKLRLEDGVLTMGATLNAQIFGGGAAISDMRMEGVFSQWPRFQANIRLDHLDLEQVTQAFSFGRITGKLSGEIEHLNLFNWQPVAFDARLYTPEDDRSRHRISQRAVQNIGSLGGSEAGVAAALQSGFLRFFEDFNYDRLGLACRLENEVCVMNGVAPAANGAYYLVKGKGLPRIDVIGNAARVDWPRMLAQLKAATESPGPVVR